MKFRKHFTSYRYAAKGIWQAFRYENNMRFHTLGAVLVVVFNYWLKVTANEWLISLLLIGVVWMAEVFNTAIEKLADRVTTEHDTLIGQVKDLASGAVLVICIIAAICGGIIYIPYLLQWWQR